LVSYKFKDYDYVISIDSDILVNTHAPALPLDIIPKGKVAAVNERKYFGNYEWRENVQLMQNWEKTGIEWYALSGETKTYNDHINGGFIIYQPTYHGDLFYQLYNDNVHNYQRYHQDDQSFLSSYLIDNNMVFWLDERYNKIWFFWRKIFYPDFDNLSNETKKLYVNNFVKHNYFCHFTGLIDIEHQG
jgi:hypothetical protein